MKTYTKDDGTVVSYYPVGTQITIKSINDLVFTVADYIEDESAYFIKHNGIFLENVVVFADEIELYYGNINLDGDGI